MEKKFKYLRNSLMTKKTSWSNIEDYKDKIDDEEGEEKLMDFKSK